VRWLKRRRASSARFVVLELALNVQLRDSGRRTALMLGSRRIIPVRHWASCQPYQHRRRATPMHAPDVDSTTNKNTDDTINRKCV